MSSIAIFMDDLREGRSRYPSGSDPSNAYASFIVARGGESERALDPAEATERLRQAGERARHPAPEANVRGGVAAVHGAGRDVAVDARLRRHLRTVAERLVPGESDLAAEHDAAAEDRRPGEADLRRDQTLRADPAAVRDLDEVVDLRSAADARRAERR